jgi:hypothetical protein
MLKNVKVNIKLFYINLFALSLYRIKNVTHTTKKNNHYENFKTSKFQYL